MKRVKKVYSAAPGASFTDKKAGIYGRELDRLIRGHGHCLKPSEIVEAAEEPDSPLHDHFEWDDNKAAHGYRLWQGRQLTNHLLVKIEEVKMPVKAFHSVPIQQEDGTTERAYVSFRRVAEEEPFREAVLQRALAEGKHWRDRYAEVKELAGIFTDVDRAVEKYKAA